MEDTHLCLVCQERIVGLMNYVTHKQTKCANQKQTSASPPETENHTENGVDSKGKTSGLSGKIEPDQMTSLVLENIPETTNNTPPLSSYECSLLSDGGGIVQPTAASNVTQTDSVAGNPPDTFETERLSLDLNQLNNFINEDFHTMPSQGSPTHQMSAQNLNNSSVTSPTTDSFFQSLELQSRKSPRKAKQGLHSESRNLYSNLENLSISNFLNNLDFSSDEDLTNFDDLDDSDYEENNEGNPPRNHTGGKWKPGEYPGSKSHRTSGKKVPGGKWKPGMLSKMPPKQNRKKTKNKVEFICKACNLTFLRGVVYAAHCRQASHKEKMAKLNEQQKNLQSLPEVPHTVTLQKNEGETTCETLTPNEENMVVEESETNKETEPEQTCARSRRAVKAKDPIKKLHICTICDKKFSRKYEIVQHLMTKYHKNRAMNHADKLDMIVKYEQYIVKLSAYQCAICQFYFNNHSDLVDHFNTEQHAENCENCIGVIKCLLCDCAFENFEDLKLHVGLESHLKEVLNSENSKICIIKDVVDLKCKYCGAKQASVTRLKRHIAVRHSDQKITKPLTRTRGGDHPKCPHCNYVAAYRSSLDIHIRRIHTENRPFSCGPCNKRFSEKYSYEKHLKTLLHARKMNIVGGGDKVIVSWSAESENACITKTVPRMKRNLRCDKCDFETDRYIKLRAHSIETHTDEVTLCKLCNQNFLSVKAYRVHCSGKTHQDNMGQVGELNADGEEGGEVLECAKCSKKFSDKKWLDLHTQFIHNHISTEEQVLKQQGKNNKVQQLYGDHLEQIKSVPFDASVSCPECGKFIHHERIVEHLRLHTNEKPFVCNICNRGFIGRLSLRRHLMVHVGLTENTCSICNREFKRYNSYKLHMELHQSQEQHICSVCGQTFPLMKQLTHHMKRHGDRPHKCTFPDCTWSFVLRNELSMHLLTHTGEKKYLCDTCGFAAATKSRLQRHTRTHTGERQYHCEYCTYKAGNSTHLRRHMRIHIGSKPFKCPYCPYSCNTHENIRKHITKTKKHQGMPIYPCTLCEYGTNSTKDFRAHLVTVHSDTVKLDGLDKLAEYSGLYKRDADPSKPIEGRQILPSKERHGTRNPKTVQMQVSDAVNETIVGKVDGEAQTAVEDTKAEIEWTTEDTSEDTCIKKWENIPTVAYQTEVTDQKFPTTEYHIIQGANTTYADLTQMGAYDNMMNVIVLEGQFTPQ